MWVQSPVLEKKKKKVKGLGMAEAGDQDFKTRLGYIVSMRPGRDPVSKKKQSKKE